MYIWFCNLSFRLHIALLIFCGCWIGCSPNGQTRLTITGSSTVAPLMNEIAKRYETTHPEIRIDVQTGGSSRGIADIRRGLADIGMVSRNLNNSEQDLQSYTIAQDGIGIIVNANNPISQLTSAQIQSIYTTTSDDWLVVNKASGRATLEVFLDYFNLEETTITADVVIGDNEQCIKTVAGDKNAIGYVSIGAAEQNIKLGSSIKLIAIDGQTGSSQRLASGAYPLSRPLNLVTKKTYTDNIKKYIAFAQSSTVHDLINSLYFVPFSN